MQNPDPRTVRKEDGRIGSEQDPKPRPANTFKQTLIDIGDEVITTLRAIIVLVLLSALAGMCAAVAFATFCKSLSILTR